MSRESKNSKEIPNRTTRIDETPSVSHLEPEEQEGGGNEWSNWNDDDQEYDRSRKSLFTLDSTQNIRTQASRIYVLQGKGRKSRLGSHCHKPVSEEVDVKAKKKLIIASVLCLVFMIGEAIGGVLAHSLAIATDAAHLLTDFAAFMISLFAIWLAGRKATQRLSFGWHRAEVLGALVSILLIWFITAILVWMAIDRIRRKDLEVDGKIMLITSGIAIIVNGIIALQLHHGPSHGHSHGNTRENDHKSEQTRVEADEESAKKKKSFFKKIKRSIQDRWSKRSTTRSQEIDDTDESKSEKDQFKPMKSATENINVRAAFIHVIGDMFQSVGVFVAALIIFFRPEYGIADPICTFLFSVLVLFSTFYIIRDVIVVLMEGTPKYMEYDEVMQTFANIEGVNSVHNLRIWGLSVNKVALSVHLSIDPDVDPKRVLKEAQKAVHSYYDFFETTIQIEQY